MEHRLRHHIIEPAGDWNGNAVICLPGRGGNMYSLATPYAEEPLLGKFKIIGIEPDKEWYPSPRGPKDQKEAVHGLAGAAVNLGAYIQNLLKEEKISPYNVAIAGFSAGGVMAIQTAAMANWTQIPLTVVHSGCVLDSSILPERTLTVLMFHSKDDTCFDWNERYQPSKEALKKKGYQLICIERERGGHTIPSAELYEAASSIFRKFDFE